MLELHRAANARLTLTVRRAEPFRRRHFGERLALLLSLPNGPFRIAEGHNREDFVGVGETDILPNLPEAAKPVQFEPTPSAHAVRIIPWIARLASDTPNRLLRS